MQTQTFTFKLNEGHLFFKAFDIDMKELGFLTTIEVEAATEDEAWMKLGSQLAYHSTAHVLYTLEHEDCGPLCPIHGDARDTSVR